MIKTELKVKGFHCTSCEMLVKDIASDFPEISSCQIDIKTGKVVLQHKKGFDAGKFKKEIEKSGTYVVV